MESLGSNVLFVFRFPVFGQRPTTEMLTRKQMTYDDAMAMRGLPHVVAVSPALQYTDNNAPGRGGVTAIKGRREQHAEHHHDRRHAAAEGCARPRTCMEGRFFNEGDQERAAKVTVLGYDTAEELFPDQSAIGKDVTVSGMLFTVVGVLDKQKTGVRRRQ